MDRLELKQILLSIKGVNQELADKIIEKWGEITPEGLYAKYTALNKESGLFISSAEISQNLFDEIIQRIKEFLGKEKIENLEVEFPIEDFGTGALYPEEDKEK